MPTPVAVAVPVGDEVALVELTELVEQPGELTRVTPFDGEAAIQVLLFLSASSFPFFKTWITTRAAARREYKVSVDGIELTGYTEAEVARLLEAVHEQIKD